jgi:hypothetical protein
MLVPKLAQNGSCSPFMILGQFWASRLFLNSLPQPAFSNRQWFAEQNKTIFDHFGNTHARLIDQRHLALADETFTVLGALGKGTAEENGFSAISQNQDCRTFRRKDHKRIDGWPVTELFDVDLRLGSKRLGTS